MIRRRCNNQCTAGHHQPPRHVENADFHQPGARQKLNSKRINGAALEMIMRDVLHGMDGFTNEVCSGSEMGRMEIIAVEEAENSSQEKATVIPFPGAASKS
jgi:hypothetical protein